MLRINLVRAVRQRLALLLTVGFVSLLCCIGGAFASFVVAPQQRIDASRTARMSTLSYEAFQAAPAGERLIVMGALADNPPISDEGEFVAYQMERWTTTLIQDEEQGDFYTGKWDTENRVTEIPVLNVSIEGGTVATLPTESLRLTGALHEEIFESDSAEVDLTNKRPDDSRRYEGLRNGDTVTILGAKGSGGALIPEALYAGDRVAFDQSNVNQASSLFQMGICMMGLAPLLLLAGLLFALFKR